jgi:TonB family protein
VRERWNFASVTVSKPIMRVCLFLLLTMSAFGQAPAEPTDARGWLNKGVQSFKAANYEEAERAFQRSIDLNPGEVTGHLYLGTALVSRYVPGVDSPANRDVAARAEAAFRSALAIDPEHRVALKTMASLKYQQATATRTHSDKIAALDEAERWYRQIIEIDPSDREALYSVGVIAWSKVYPENQRARESVGMRREDPGPVRDNNVRLDLQNRYGSVIRDGMTSLHKAIEVDPRYDDAMAYLNLMYRQLADVSDSAEDYKRYIAEADMWVQRALETKKVKAAAGVAPNPNMVPAPPPPPAQIRVAGNVMAAKLVNKVAPIYPLEAKQARIQGVVRFNAVVARDGTLGNLTLVSGHPLLVPAALEAVRQWRYQPTLLNGQAVEVVTQIDINFTLSE